MALEKVSIKEVINEVSLGKGDQGFINFP